METSNENLYNPIRINPMPQEIRQLINSSNKNSETKLYLLLYITAEGESRFEQATGRMECYQTIVRIMAQHPDVDVNDAVILVEVPAINRDGNGEWMLKHINKAPTFYQFCKQYESLFPNIDFNIDEYVDREATEESKEDETVSIMNASANEMSDVYRNLMNEKEKEK